MRILATLLAAALLGWSAVSPAWAADRQHIQELLTGIFQEVGAILTSFSGGPDDPKGPVTDGATLQRDVAHLDSATRKAHDLASELAKLQAGSDEPPRPQQQQQPQHGQ